MSNPELIMQRLNFVQLAFKNGLLEVAKLLPPDKAEHWRADAHVWPTRRSMMCGKRWRMRWLMARRWSGGDLAVAVAAADAKGDHTPDRTRLRGLSVRNGRSGHGCHPAMIRTQSPALAWSVISGKCGRNSM